MKKVTFFSGSSQVMRRGFITINQKPSRRALEVSIITCCKEIQGAIISRQVDIDHLLGFSGAILETYVECGTTVKRTAYCDMLQRGLKCAVHSKSKGDCQRASCCCTTMFDPILQTTCWKPSGN
jgi:hypothetical protein